MKVLYFTAVHTFLHFAAQCLPPSTPLTAITQGTNATCANPCGGSASVTASGGIGSYHYLWTPGNDSADSISNLCAGTYIVKISDSIGNIVNDTVNITIPSASQPVIAATDTIICAGDSAQLCVTQTYDRFSWNALNNTQCIYAFAAGTYYVTVTDSHNCSATSSAVVTVVSAPVILPVTVNATCYNDYNGEATAEVFSGTPPYQYLWTGDGSAKDSSMINLSEGIATVTVTDANQCTATDTFNLK